MDRVSPSPSRESKSQHQTSNSRWLPIEFCDFRGRLRSWVRRWIVFPPLPTNSNQPDHSLKFPSFPSVSPLSIPPSYRSGIFPVLSLQSHPYQFLPPIGSISSPFSQPDRSAAKKVTTFVLSLIRTPDKLPFGLRSCDRLAVSHTSRFERKVTPFIHLLAASQPNSTGRPSSTRVLPIYSSNPHQDMQRRTEESSRKLPAGAIVVQFFPL
ncbi:unnamed protein product [Linum trigynum]|uniref:Uncharacterized protein n=1 Tax=Linum trigynum TaxID=586398 RepID=A0AAV2G1W7_9ROSI